jgi:exosortase
VRSGEKINVSQRRKGRKEKGETLRDDLFSRMRQVCQCPLQLLASRIAAAILHGAGVSVVREGIILNVAGHRVAVEEACNGTRYLLSLGFSAVVFAYLSDSKPWMRIALLAAALPVAVLANAARVAANGFFPALDAGAPHERMAH